MYCSYKKSIETWINERQHLMVDFTSVKITTLCYFAIKHVSFFKAVQERRKSILHERGEGVIPKTTGDDARSYLFCLHSYGAAK